MSRLDLIDDWLAWSTQARFRAGELAICCDVTDRQLRRYFKLTVGVSVQRWLNEIRLWESIRMLHRGDRIKEICSELHFSSASQFCAQFRRRFDLTPCTFRQDTRGAQAPGQGLRPARERSRVAAAGPGRELAQLRAGCLAELKRRTGPSDRV